MEHIHNWYHHSYLVLGCDGCDALKRDEGELDDE
jgi:hypothetical protein